MKILALVTCFAAGGLFYNLKPAQPPGNLQGQWKVVAAPEDWKILPGTKVEVTASEILILLGPVKKSAFRYSADYQFGNLDAEKTNEKPRLGKFSLSGETVTLSIGTPGGTRPKTAASTEDGALRWILKRAPRI